MGMKLMFVVVAIFVAFCSADSIFSADTLTLNGHRPTINSGDAIALRSARNSSGIKSKPSDWLYCTRSSCAWKTCQGKASCSKQIMFIITARGKEDGEPINSGDTVSLSSKAYGTSYRLYCGSSNSTACRTNSVNSSMTGGNWLKYSYATFQIFSGDEEANDGTPVQYGDVVGLKFQYSTNSAWLSYSGGHFYPRSCSSNSKKPCAAKNTNTGFMIFKKL